MSWSRLIGGLESQAAGGGLESVISPQLTALGYASWGVSPIKAIPPNALMELFHRSYIPFDTYKSGMACHGAEVNADTKRLWQLKMGGLRHVRERIDLAGGYTPWDIIQAAQEWTPPLVVAMEIWNRDWVSDEVFEYWMRQLGMSDPAMQRIIKKMTAYVPPVQDLIRMSVREVFDPRLRRELDLDAEIDRNPDYLAWASAQGLREVEIPDGKGGFHKRNFARDYWAAHWTHESPTQAFEMYHRLRPNRLDRLPDELRQTKPYTLEDVRRLLRIQDYAPGVRDRLAAIAFRPLGRIDARRLFRSRTVLGPELKEMFQDFGYNPADAQLLVDFEEWSLQNQITVPQLSALLRRKILRPEEYKARIVRRGYTLDDAGRLEALQERLPTVMQVARWVRKGLMEQEEAIDSLWRLGFTRDTASRYVTEAQNDRRRRITGPRVPRILDAIRHGVIGEDEGRRLLLRLGYSRDEVEEFITDDRLQERIDRVKAGQKRVRRQYLSGALDRPQALAALRFLGMLDQDADQRVTIWDGEFGLPRRELSAQQTVDLLKRGIISPAEAQRRLFNLGYDSRTAQILLLAGEQDRQAAVARARIQAARTAKQQEDAALAAIRRARQEEDKAKRDLAAHGSPPTLQRWLRRGLITPREVYRRLRALGWPRPDALRLIEESRRDAEREPLPEEEVPAGQAQPGAQGQAPEPRAP